MMENVALTLLIILAIACFGMAFASDPKPEYQLQTMQDELGAYVLDKNSGKIWYVPGTREPVFIGRVQ